MSYNLFLDDEREPIHCMYVYRYGIRPDIYVNRKWIIVRSYTAFIAIITKKGLPDLISFDHDLADIRYTSLPEEYNNLPTSVEKDGYDCVMWLIEHCSTNNKNLPDCVVHSTNPVGRKRILTAIEKGVPGK